jgi:hypothetical protein
VRVGRGPLLVWLFAVVQFGEAGEVAAVDLVLGGGGDDAVGDGAEGGGAVAVLEQGAFPHDGAGPSSATWVPSTQTLSIPSSSR